MHRRNLFRAAFASRRGLRHLARRRGARGDARQDEGGLSPERPRQGPVRDRQHREPFRGHRRARQGDDRAGRARSGVAGVPCGERQPGCQRPDGQFAKSGVELAACGNTMKTQKVDLKDLLPGFVSLDRGGVVRIAELQSQGYLYLRPVIGTNALRGALSRHKIVLDRPISLFPGIERFEWVIPRIRHSTRHSIDLPNAIVDIPASHPKAAGEPEKPTTGQNRHHKSRQSTQKPRSGRLAGFPRPRLRRQGRSEESDRHRRRQRRDLEPRDLRKAIGSSDEYDGAIGQALKKGDRPVADLFEHRRHENIQNAADVLRPVYDQLKGEDGFVSLEVSPYLAMDTKGTIAEAERLWKDVGEELMVRCRRRRKACLRSNI